MINKHITLLPNKFFIKKKVIDITFGFGGYISNINNIKNFFGFDKNIFSIFLFKKKYKKNFFIFNTKIKNINFILNRFNIYCINILIYDQGFNSCEIKQNYFFLNKKKYNKFKNIFNKNYYIIFNNIIKYFSNYFLIIFNVFNIYEFNKIYFFIKKKNIKYKILKLNNFLISLNNSLKNSFMFILYV